MSDLNKARALFHGAGLAFPGVPEPLAARLREQGEWLFSTRKLKTTPYDINHYVHESEQDIEDYVVLAHSGHSTNSYAIQYYLVIGPLRLFLHLAWGGIDMNAEETSAEIRECFSLADEIVLATSKTRILAPGERLTIVCTSFYGSEWFTSPNGRWQMFRNDASPTETLKIVLRWLNHDRPNQALTKSTLE